MKKIVHINLGGRALAVDTDAFEALDKYLRAIERHFKKSEGFEDIMYDIENRISEILDETTAKNEVVTTAIVQRVINTMGNPQDFGAEENDENYSSKQNNSKIKTGKRLFRDPEDKILAGVASGVSQYFGISDPIIIRILFVIFTLSGGLGLLTYIVLWVAVPKAKTTSDFLSMKGEEINIDNIAKSVEDGLRSLKDTIDDLSKGIKTKML